MHAPWLACLQHLDGNAQLAGGWEHLAALSLHTLTLGGRDMLALLRALSGMLTTLREFRV